jgi:hypothetical protein
LDEKGSLTIGQNNRHISVHRGFDFSVLFSSFSSSKDVAASLLS